LHFLVEELGQELYNEDSSCSEGTVNSAFEINGTVVKNGNISADMRKFTEYIFKDGAAPGKDVVYKNLGYSMENSQALTKNYVEQAMTKYKNGQYQINGDPTQYGQKINIEIELPGIGNEAGKTSYLKSGWMIRPDGSITLNTPFSGFTK
jgi:filamentous hemagglutinin